MRKIFLGHYVLGTLLFLTACESTPTRYHALAEGEGQGLASPSGDARILIEVAPISLPGRVNRPEIVTSGADGRVRVLEFDQWAGDLANEVKLVLDQTLWKQLGAADVYQAPLPDGAAGKTPYYRLNVSITQFDAVPGKNATIDGTWTVRRLGGEKPAICRFTTVQPLPGESAAEIASALRQGVGVFAKAISLSVERLQKGSKSPCANLEMGY